MDLRKLIEQITRNGAAQVLIVGARGDNFPPRYHQHPQLVIWGEGERRRSVPEKVRLILPLRFLTHNLWRGLIEEARKRNIVMLGLKGTGEVKRILEPLLQAGQTAQPPSPQQQEAPEPLLSKVDQVVGEALATLSNSNSNSQAQPKETLRGWLDRHVIWQALDPKQQKGTKSAEARRLLELAHAEGYVSATHGGIDVELGRMRKIRFGGAVATVAAVAKLQKQVKPVKAHGKAKPKRVVVANMSEEDRQLLKLVAEGKAALELIADALKGRSQKRQALISALRGL